MSLYFVFSYVELIQNHLFCLKVHAEGSIFSYLHCFLGFELASIHTLFWLDSRAVVFIAYPSPDNGSVDTQLDAPLSWLMLFSRHCCRLIFCLSSSRIFWFLINLADVAVLIIIFIFASASCLMSCCIVLLQVTALNYHILYLKFR